MPPDVSNIAAGKIIKNTNFTTQNIENIDLYVVLNYHHRIEAGPASAAKDPCADSMSASAAIDSRPGSNNRGHVYFRIGVPRQIPVCQAVQYLKWKRSRSVLLEYKALRKRYSGKTSKGQGMSGSIERESERCGVERYYIKNQQSPEQHDSFTSCEDNRSNGRLFPLQAEGYPLSCHRLPFTFRTSQRDDCKLDVCQPFTTRYSCSYT